MQSDSIIFPSGMPTWVAGYLALYICFSLWAFIDDWSKRRLTFTVFLEVIGSAALILVALSYWSFSIRSFLLGWTALIYVVGLLALTVFVFKRVAITISEPEISLRKKIWLAVSGASFLLFFNLPLIWFGGKSLYF
jgi:hypothetical protein